MNRKIFTLLLGALMIVSSLFTVNAQRTVPYTPKTSAFDVNFEDLLSADLISTLPGNPGSDALRNSYFLLSVTGIANPTSEFLSLSNTLNANYLLSDSTLVLSIDSIDREHRYLRVDYLAKTDTLYRFPFNAETNRPGSYKFGALRNSLWCTTIYDGIVGSNIVFDFTQMNTGITLLAPSIFDRDPDSADPHYWDATTDGNDRFRHEINTLDPRMMIGGWHFSQTYASNQNLQRNMPLYSYLKRDSVAVLVLNEQIPYNDAARYATTGGFAVSVKYVAVNDLIMDAIGNVRITGPNVVNNVLLFSLKKVNKFVMNANDWNAVRNQYTFNLDANVLTHNEDKGNYYYNPFTKTELPLDTSLNYHPLVAYEVSDSLYHYGYMQFERTNHRLDPNFVPTNENYLYVDTGWINYGNNQYLAFGWGPRRNSTEWMRNAYGAGLSFPALYWGASIPLAQDITVSPTPSWFGYMKYAATSTVPTIDPAYENVYWELDRALWIIAKYLDDQGVRWDDGAGGTGLTLITPSGCLYATSDYEIEATGNVIYLNLIRQAFNDYWPGAFAGNEANDYWDRIVQDAINYSGDGNLTVQSGTGNRPAGDGTDMSTSGSGGVPITFVELFHLKTGATSLNSNGYGYDAIYCPPTPFDWSDIDALRAIFEADSLAFLWQYMKDSIMENQSKFRVVYDPTYDSTFINVYQSRMQYPDYSQGSHNAVDPPWWTNSFGEKTWNAAPFTGQTFVTRPSDLFTRTPYGVVPVLPVFSMPEAAWNYSSQVKPLLGPNYYSTATVRPTAWGWTVEGHGQGINGDRVTVNSTDPSIFNFHSFMEYYPQSTIPGIDKVLISTADTVCLYAEFNRMTYTIVGGVPNWTAPAATPNFRSLSHHYGWTLTGGTNGMLTYRDSLLYVDIQSLEGASRRIVTLNQSYKNGGKGLNTKISIQFGDKCVGDVNGPVTIDNDLYLIRNTLGQYLSVPLWSITDSIYWVTPEANEDLTKIPSYQWAVMSIRPNSPASPFRLANREFEKVQIPLMYVYEYDRPFAISGDYSHASFNNRDVNAGTTPKARALAWGSIPTKDFSDNVETRFPLGEFTFIRLGDDVKNNQLLGYKYIDKDSTYIDVYAFKFLHFQRKDVPVYLSWDGYNNPKDTVLYAMGEDYYDKLYFNLKEMTYDDIYPDWYDDLSGFRQGRLVLNYESVENSSRINWEYRPLYDHLTAKDRIYTNILDGIVLERFGYWEPYNITGIENLKPLARQAYRLFLQDYYRWHPTEKGHYVTVGEQDRYVLSDKANATKPYQASSHSVVNLFGVPFFYFRETFFDVYKDRDDYFAMVQRIDTLRDNPGSTNYIRDTTNYFNWGLPTYGDIYNYMMYIYGYNVAKVEKVLGQMKDNRELGLALLDIDPAWLRAKFVIRGDAANNTNISAFQLDRDEEPIYRRFHKNEPNEEFGGDLYDTDEPDILEFHLLNQAERGYKLYENSGNYLDDDNKTDLFGADGGRIYNRDKDGRGDYYLDTLKNVISFLGMNNSVEYPNTNRAFYVDTAYIGRGTGWIKPQYLLAVDPYKPKEDPDCDPILGDIYPPNQPYVIARYLYNTAQYSKAVKDSVLSPAYDWEITDEYYRFYNYVTGVWVDSVKQFSRDNFNKVEPIKETVLRKPNGESYTYDDKWERLAFSWAIHYGDSLYVLKGTELEPGYMQDWANDPKRVYDKLIEEYGTQIGTSKVYYLDFNKLISQNVTGSYKELYYPNGDRSIYNPIIRTYNTFRTTTQLANANPKKTIGLHAIINLADNTHKDWVFSFRYVERGSSDFIIESEVSDRDIRYGAIIRPGYGGWVKSQNGVPVITRSDEKDNMGQAGGSVMNVKQLTNPVDNERILQLNKSSIDVVGGIGNVTIRNAAGKKVVISNMLGQTVANVTLNSDKASIPAPAGVIIVSVEGESAAKVIVR